MGDSNRIEILRALALSSMPSLAKRHQKQNSSTIDVSGTKPLVPAAPRKPDKEEGELSSDDEFGRPAPPRLTLESSLPYNHRNAGLSSNAPLQGNVKEDTHSSAATPVDSVLHIGVSSTSVPSSAARVSIVNKLQLLSAFSAQAPSLTSSSTPKQVTATSGDFGVLTRARSDVVQATVEPSRFTPSLTDEALKQGLETRLPAPSPFKKPPNAVSLTRPSLLITDSSVSQSSVLGTFAGLLGPIPTTSDSLFSPQKSSREVSALVSPASVAARPVPLTVSVVPAAASSFSPAWLAALESTSEVGQKYVDPASGFDGSDFLTVTDSPSPVVPVSVSPTARAIDENGAKGVRKEADAFLASLRIPVANTVVSEDSFVIKFDEDSDSDGDNGSLSIPATEQLEGDTQKGANGSPGALSTSTGSQTIAFMSNPGSSDINAEINRMKKQIAAMERTHGKSAVFQVPVKPNNVGGAEVPRHFLQAPLEAKPGVPLATSVRPVSNDLESMRLRIAAKESELQQRRQKLAVKGPEGSKGVTGFKGTGIIPAPSPPLNLTTVQISEDPTLQLKDQLGKVSSEKGPNLKKETHRRVDGIPALALAGPAGANLGGFKSSPERKGLEAVEGNTMSNTTSSHVAPPGTVSSGQRRRPPTKTLKRSRSEEADEPLKAQRVEDTPLREKVDVSDRSKETPTLFTENHTSRHGNSSSTPVSGQLKRKAISAESSGIAVDITSLPNSERGKKYKMDHVVGSASDRVSSDEFFSIPHRWSGQGVATMPPISHLAQAPTILAETFGNESTVAGNSQSQVKDVPEEANDTAEKESREVGTSLTPIFQGEPDNAREVATDQSRSRNTVTPTEEIRGLGFVDHSASLHIRRAESPVSTFHGPSSLRADPAFSAGLTTSLARGQQEAQPALGAVMTHIGWQRNTVSTMTANDNFAVGKSGLQTTVPLLPPVISQNRGEHRFQLAHLSSHGIPEHYSVQQLLEEEELLDRQLEDLQEVRLRCERRERLARREYRESQSALRAANADCDALTQRKEFLLSQLHVAEAREWAPKSYSSRSQALSGVPFVDHRRNSDEPFPDPVSTSHVKAVDRLPVRFAAVDVNGDLDHPLRLTQRFPSPHSPKGMELATVASGSEQPGSSKGGEGHRLGMWTKTTEIGNERRQSSKTIIERDECGRRINNGAAAAVVAEDAGVESRLAQVNRPDVFQDGEFLRSNSRAGFREMSNATENFLSFQSDSAKLKSSSISSRGPSVASDSGSGRPMKAAIVVDSTPLEKIQSERESLKRCTEGRPGPISEKEAMMSQAVATDAFKGTKHQSVSERPLSWKAEQTNVTDVGKGGSEQEATFTTLQKVQGFELAHIGKEVGGRGGELTTSQDQGFEPARLAAQDISGAQMSQMNDISEALNTQEDLSQSEATLDHSSEKFSSSVHGRLSSAPSRLPGADVSLSADRNDETQPVTEDRSTLANRNNRGTEESHGRTPSPMGVFIQNKAAAEFKLLQNSKRSSKDVRHGPGIDVESFRLSESTPITDGKKGTTSGPSADRGLDGRNDQAQEHLVDSFDNGMMVRAEPLQDSHRFSVAGINLRDDLGGVKASTTSQPVLPDVKANDPAALKEVTASEVPSRLAGREVSPLNDNYQGDRSPSRLCSNGVADGNARPNVELRKNGNKQQTPVLAVQDLALGTAGSNDILEQKPNIRNGGLPKFRGGTALESDMRKFSDGVSTDFVPGTNSDRAVLRGAGQVSKRGSPVSATTSSYAHSEEGNLGGGISGVHGGISGVETNEIIKVKDSKRSPVQQRVDDAPKNPKQFHSRSQVHAFEHKPDEHGSRGFDSAKGGVAHDDCKGLNTVVNNREGMINPGDPSVVQVGRHGPGLNVDLDAGDRQTIQAGHSEVEERQHQDGQGEENKGSLVETFEGITMASSVREKSILRNEAADTVNSRHGEMDESLPQPQHDSVEHVVHAVADGELDLSDKRDLHIEESLQAANSNSTVDPEDVKPTVPTPSGGDIRKSPDGQTAVSKELPSHFANIYVEEQAIERWVPSACPLAVLNCIPRSASCIPTESVSGHNSVKPPVESKSKAWGESSIGSSNYKSPLTIFRSCRVSPHSSEKLYPRRNSNTWSHTISPFKLLCKFEHRGKCNNGDCPWQHAEDYTLSSEQLESQIQSYTAGDTANSNNGIVPSNSQSGSTLSFAAVATPPSQQSITSVARTVVSALSKTRQKSGLSLLTISPGPVPIYRNGMYKLKAEDFTEKHFLTYSLQLDRGRDNFSSFLLSLSVHRPLPPDMPCLLDTPEYLSLSIERSQAHLMKSPDRRHKHESQKQPIQTNVDGTEQDSIEEEAWLEMALREIEYDCSTPNDRQRDQALYYLSRALESRPSSTPLWVVYASLFHLRRHILEEDDMFQHAVSFNKGSYGLWILYINSRPDFEMRLDAYETSIVALWSHAQQNPAAEKEQSSACVLDVCLQMLYCWSVAGRLESASMWVDGLIREASSGERHDSATSPAALLSCLTQHDACILWIACTYLLACSQLPTQIVSRLGCKQELPENFSWEKHAKLDEATCKQVIGTLKAAASEGLGCLALESTPGDGDGFAKEALGINYVQCLALYEGLESAGRFGAKMMALYPTSVDLVIICARVTERQKGQSMGLHVFEEALRRWPEHDRSGIQYFWNQYAGHALVWGGKDAAKRAFQRCISITVNDSRQRSGISSANAKFLLSIHSGESENSSVDQLEEGWASLAQYFVAVAASHIGNYQSVSPEDRVFTLLSLAFVKALGRDVPASQDAINKALKEAAPQKIVKHCWRELAASHVLHGPESSTGTYPFTLGENLLILLDRYAKESRVVSHLKPLFRKSFEGIKKLQMRTFFEDMVGPTPPDYSLLNSLLQTIYGPKLLPEGCSFTELCHLGEGILEAFPGNVPLAMSLCRTVLQVREAPTQICISAAVWACALLVGALFQSYPVAPEAYWVETGLILRQLAERRSMEEFYRKALLTYPYSAALQRDLKGVRDEQQGSEFNSRNPERRRLDSETTETHDGTVKD